MAKDTRDLEVSTYDDLYLSLSLMSAIQRAQPIQAIHPQPVDGDAVIPLLPVIYFGTLQELGYDKTKSSKDAQHHPEHYVLGFDQNMLNDDGTVAVVDMLAEEPPKPPSTRSQDLFENLVMAVWYWDVNVAPVDMGATERDDFETARRAIAAWQAQIARGITLEKAMEALDNLSASFDTVLGHYGPSMPPADYQSRQQRVKEARDLCDRYLRPNADRDEDDEPVTLSPTPPVPPDPDDMNDRRAELAEVAVTAYANEAYQLPGDREDRHMVVGDILCNLRHFCDRNGIKFSEALQNANGHYHEETQGDTPQFTLTATIDPEVQAVRLFEAEETITLGELRRITECMPDATPIGPRFPDHVPDEYPSVRIVGFGVEKIPTRELPLLAVLVEQVPLNGEDDEVGDDVCDLCMTSNVHVERTTYCGKTIGIECGCEESSDGTCDNENCEACIRGAADAVEHTEEDDEQSEEGWESDDAAIDGVKHQPADAPKEDEDGDGT